MSRAATIELGNAVSRVACDPDILIRVRWLVSYQEEALPPPGIQAALKSIMSVGKRHGYEYDVERIYGDPATSARFADAGWPAERMTREVFERVLRQRGCWDGWVSLVDSRGWFGTGLLGHVQRALELRCGIRHHLLDLRTPAPPGRPWGTEPQLYAHQREAAEAFLVRGRGVADLPPRTGKTRIAAYLIHRLGLPTLYVAPQIGIVGQTVKAFREFFPADQVVALTGGRPNAKATRVLNQAMVWVATPGSAAGSKPDVGRRVGVAGLASRRFLVIDEFHHAAAETYQDLSRAMPNAPWRLGLTGTHFRADGRDMEMHSVIGEAIYSRSVQDMVEAGRLVPARVAMVRIPSADVRELSGRDLYADGVVNHPGRNSVLIRAVLALVVAGKRVLVLAKEKDHTRVLSDGIPGSVRVDGETGAEEIPKVLARLNAGEIRVVVGTSVIGEGRDVPAADALVYACAGSSRVKVIQDTYRVLTPHPGKRWGIVIDAADDHHPKLTDSAVDRLAIYRSEPGFSAEVIPDGNLEAWVAGAA